MDAATSLTHLRWTRSDPPGAAAADEKRRATYCAALQQFEELLGAAQSAGTASKPLPLFYALSQAGRAIVAAYGERGETHGHGLSEDRTDPADTPLLWRHIERTSRKDDTFGAVARATRSGDFDGKVQVGATWVANPHAPRLPLEHWRPDWRLALFVLEEKASPPAGTDLHEHAQLLRVMPFSDPLEATASHGSDLGHERYPTIPAEAGATSVPREADNLRSWSGYVVWRVDETPLEQVAPRPTFDDERYLIPLLPGQRKMLSPLLLWWVLLYGFSVYARYHPELWIRTLDVDHSSVAVGIEHVMKTAADRIPALVYEAVSGRFYPVPDACRMEGPSPPSSSARRIV
jgi:hypothetical protein